MRYTTLLAGALGLSVAAVAAPGAAAQDTTRTQQESRGAVESARIDNRGLSRSQVERLQARLNELGCEAGPVDGLIGPRTRQAIDCARQRENVTGTGLAELMRALGLDEAAGDVTPAPQERMQRDTSAMRDTMMRSDPMMSDTLMRRDTTLQRDPVMRDTTMRDTLMRRDTLRLQQDTMRRDTLQRDTLRRDTTRSPRDTIRDTVPPRPPRG